MHAPPRKRALTSAVIAACLALLLFAAPSSADPSRDGWGLGIADDNWPQQGVLDTARFANLKPKTYRLLIPWNATSRTDADYRDKANQLIDKARSAGVEQVVLSFRVLNSEGNAPNEQAYRANISQFISEFDAKVDAWSPINEPNVQFPDPFGPALAAAYYNELRQVLAARGSQDKLLSPDFADRQDSSDLVTYLADYKSFGGGFGDYLALHPYYDVRDRSLTRTNAAIAACGCSQPVWVTEVGAKISGSQSPGLNVGTTYEQNLRVAWMANAQNGLASVDRIEKILYYQVRGDSGWDSGLTETNAITPRDAWYTWCAATHGDNASAIDCGPPADGATAPWIGFVKSDGTAWFQETPVTSNGWRVIASNVKQMVLTHNRAAVLQNDGRVWYQDAPFSAGGWKVISSNVKQIAMAGDRIAVVQNDGSAWFQDFPFTAGDWKVISSDVKQLVLTQGRVGVVQNTGLASYQDAPFTAGGWHAISSNVGQMAMVENGVGVVQADGIAWYQSAPFSANGWQAISSNVKQMALGGNTVTVIQNNGQGWFQDAPFTGGGWVLVSSDTKQLEPTENILTGVGNNGGLWTQNAPFSPNGWIYPGTGVSQITVAE